MRLVTRESTIPTDPARNRILVALLLVLGFMALVKACVLRMEPARSPRAGFQPVNVQVQGRVSVEAPQQGVGDLTLIFHFPEIPLDCRRTARDVGMTEEGSFRADFSFFSRRVPGAFGLTVRKTGCDDVECGGLPLAGQPLQGAVPPLLLRPHGTAVEADRL